MSKTYEFFYGEEKILVETGKLAKQAHGSVFLTWGKTQVLVSVCSSYERKEGQDFFPLTVDYKEKFFASGKFLGGFIKRESRPNEREILLMRIIDRPLRPMFPEGYDFDTIINAQVFSYEEGKDPEILAGLGASLALLVSDIPFEKAVAFSKIGKDEKGFTFNNLKDSSMEVVLACTEDAFLMVEGQAPEISEKEMLEALIFSKNHMKDFFRMCKEIQKDFPHTRTWSLPESKSLVLSADQKEKIATILSEPQKTKRTLLTQEVFQQILTTFSEEDKKQVKNLLEEELSALLRANILNKKVRIGNRAFDEIRSIETEVSYLSRPHGSALFTRGETQVLSAVTLGGKEGEQMVDTMLGLSFQKFYLHYTFMPFSVGEARMYRGASRREVGHGNLAERALKMMMPSQEVFPYTVRVTCDVLESNGSSSMATVCAGSLALMDAGVPLLKPVAGIAMGLVYDSPDKYAILTDILGDEDHLGDMDFKVAGTSQGITALQMDLKLEGISLEILEESLEQARVARLKILNIMEKTLSKTRPELKEGAPLIRTMNIEPSQIGLLIGPSGKTIKALQEKYSVNIDIEEQGFVRIFGLQLSSLESCKAEIELSLNGPTINENYQAIVVSLKPYGAFVDILNSQISGLVHVSEIQEGRVDKVEDVLKENDIVTVKVLGKDDQGKYKLSIKAAK
jgi:polyribonucleotide nucleotidyltransferase